jgi:HEAT repeat protein
MSFKPTENSSLVPVPLCQSDIFFEILSYTSRNEQVPRDEDPSRTQSSYVAAILGLGSLLKDSILGGNKASRYQFNLDQQNTLRLFQNISSPKGMLTAAQGVIQKILKREHSQKKTQQTLKRKHSEAFNEVPHTATIISGESKNYKYLHGILKSLEGNHIIKVRQSVAFTLGETNNLQELIKMKEDPDLSVRATVASALGKIKTKDSFAALIEMVNNNKDKVGFFAKTSLIKMRCYSQKKAEEYYYKELINAIQRANPDNPIIETLFEGLREIGDMQACLTLKYIQESPLFHPSKQKKAISTLIEIGNKKAYCILRVIMTNPTTSPFIVSNIMAKVLETRNNEVYGPFIDDFINSSFTNMLNYNSSIDPACLIEKLGETEGEKIDEALISMKNCTNAFVQAAVAKSLGKRKSIDSCRALISMKSDTNTYVRTAVAVSLGERKSRESCEALISMLNDESEEVQHKAIDALGQMEYQEALQALSNKKTKSTLTQSLIIKSLRNMGKKPHLRRAACAAFLEKLISHRHQITAFRTLMSNLSEIGDDETLRALRDLSKQPSFMVLPMREIEEQINRNMTLREGENQSILESFK